MAADDNAYRKRKTEVETTAGMPPPTEDMVIVNSEAYDQGEEDLLVSTTGFTVSIVEKC